MVALHHRSNLLIAMLALHHRSDLPITVPLLMMGMTGGMAEQITFSGIDLVNTVCGPNTLRKTLLNDLKAARLCWAFVDHPPRFEAESHILQPCVGRPAVVR